MLDAPTAVNGFYHAIQNMRKNKLPDQMAYLWNTISYFRNIGKNFWTILCIRSANELMSICQRETYIITLHKESDQLAPENHYPI